MAETEEERKRREEDDAKKKEPTHGGDPNREPDGRFAPEKK